ncbi:MAG: sugar phosphate isomerase/epimerase family protein [Candidatus Zipacnadales bacterium]
MDRRQFLHTATAAVGTGWAVRVATQDDSPDTRKEATGMMKLGLVTYNIAQDWDVPTLIQKCTELGIEGVELRTTHAHGVEPTLSAAQRKEVRARFEDSPVTLWGLGSTCEYHSADPEEVKRQIAICRDFVLLARDVGAVGVKVRPNGLQLERGVPEEQTLEQIGKALSECGEFAAEHGIEIWLEVHGRDTAHPPRIKAIMDYCDHPQVGICWNSNDSDIKDGSVREYFELLQDHIRSCHITELARDVYPWRELFGLLKGIGYDRFTLAEIQASPDRERLLRYYRALWWELTR